MPTANTNLEILFCISLYMKYIFPLVFLILHTLLLSFWEKFFFFQFHFSLLPCGLNFLLNCSPKAILVDIGFESVCNFLFFYFFFFQFSVFFLIRGFLMICIKKNFFFLINFHYFYFLKINFIISYQFYHF